MVVPVVGDGEDDGDLGEEVGGELRLKDEAVPTGLQRCFEPPPAVRVGDSAVRTRRGLQAHRHTGDRQSLRGVQDVGGEAHAATSAALRRRTERGAALRSGPLM
ncbi:hypothetical protein GCM10027610_001600 [Dactylosporangium cerinum]